MNSCSLSPSCPAPPHTGLQCTFWHLSIATSSTLVPPPRPRETCVRADPHLRVLTNSSKTTERGRSLKNVLSTTLMNPVIFGFPVFFPALASACSAPLIESPSAMLRVYTWLALCRRTSRPGPAPTLSRSSHVSFPFHLYPTPLPVTTLRAPPASACAAVDWTTPSSCSGASSTGRCPVRRFSLFAAKISRKAWPYFSTLFSPIPHTVTISAASWGRMRTISHRDLFCATMYASNPSFSATACRCSYSASNTTLSPASRCVLCEGSAFTRDLSHDVHSVSSSEESRKCSRTSSFAGVDAPDNLELLRCGSPAAFFSRVARGRWGSELARRAFATAGLRIGRDAATASMPRLLRISPLRLMLSRRTCSYDEMPE
mmetsp:Transcript_19014/g.43747  ORF Transcript_19014/g.43747 Transcript_19014/m.43747 type:complete len:373 (-) Transcript_19014:99-1217(-)